MSKATLPVDANLSTLRFSEGVAGNLIQLAAGESGPNSQRRKFAMLAYTGAPVRKFGTNLVFNLAGMNVPAQMPALKNHDEEQIAGTCENVTKSAAEVSVTGMLSNCTAAAKEIASLADEKFPWQCSIGVQIDFDSVTFIPENEKCSVNARELSGPLYVVGKSDLRECSFVPVGADGNTQAVVMTLSALTGKTISPACGLGVSKEKENMPEENKAPAVDTAKLQSDAIEAHKNAEKERLTQLKAAFPENIAFALEQFAAGASVEQAKNAFKDVQLAAAQSEIAALKAGGQKPAGKATGAKPADFGGANANLSGSGDFMAQAKSRAAEKGITMTAAMSQLAVENPQLHAEFVAGIKPVKVHRGDGE